MPAPHTNIETHSDPTSIRAARATMSDDRPIISRSRRQSSSPPSRRYATQPDAEQILVSSNRRVGGRTDVRGNRGSELPHRGHAVRHLAPDPLEIDAAVTMGDTVAQRYDGDHSASQVWL